MQHRPSRLRRALPLTEDGRSVEQGAADDADDPLDRRVELFFFEPEITPLPPGTNSSAGSPECQKWCEQSVLLFEMVITPIARDSFTADHAKCFKAEGFTPAVITRVKRLLARA